MPTKTLLIVDDEAALREQLAHGLAEHGFDVVGQAGDGPEALDAIAALDPDVVLMDLRMPGMSGIEVVRELRRRDDDTLVVLLSAYDDGALVGASVDAGAFDYVVKGARLSVIAGVLVQAMRRKQEGAVR